MKPPIIPGLLLSKGPECSVLIRVHWEKHCGERTVRRVAPLLCEHRHTHKKKIIFWCSDGFSKRMRFPSAGMQMREEKEEEGFHERRKAWRLGAETCTAWKVMLCRPAKCSVSGFLVTWSRFPLKNCWEQVLRSSWRGKTDEKSRWHVSQQVERRD